MSDRELVATVPYRNGNISHINWTDYYSDYYDGDVDTTPKLGRIVRDVILPIICACGILGILLTIVVLSRKNMSTSTNCYLIGLAIADLFFLILFCTRLMEKHFSPASNSYYVFEIYATYATIFMHVFLLSSIWITVMLAVERYIAICRPFLAAKICSVRRARIIVFLIFVACFICRLPNFWLHTVQRVYDTTTNSSLIYIVQSDLSMRKSYYAVYPWIVDVIITSVIPFILLLVLNACLIWQVRQSTTYIQRNLMVTHEANTSAVHREELQITTMLISVIIVFFICQAPYVIYTALASINHFNILSGMLMFRYAVLLLLTVKSAVNFILYCWFSEKFWTTLKRVFCVDACVRKLAKRKGEGQNGETYYYMKRFSSTGNTRVTCVEP